MTARQIDTLNPAVSRLLQEALLRTDGTVTDLLELFTDETIQVDKIRGDLYSPHCHRADCPDGARLEVRDVILRGATTARAYIFAHTHLFPDALPPAVRTRLSMTSDPIGKVLREYRTESFRQIQDRGNCRLPQIAAALDEDRSDRMQWRRYSVATRGNVVMEITEVFSEHLFARLA